MELSILTPDKIKEIVIECLHEFYKERETQPTSDGGAKKPPVTSKELCEFLDISAQTLNTYRKKKKIPFLRVGSSIRYDVDKVLEALNKAGK